MDENEARMMLGLPPIVTKPEDDPREWVTYHEPKEEEPEPAAEPDSLEAAIGNVLYDHYADEMTQRDAVQAILELLSRPSKSASKECPVCGALVGNMTKHMNAAHQEQLDTGEEEA